MGEKEILTHISMSYAHFLVCPFFWTKKGGGGFFTLGACFLLALLNLTLKPFFTSFFAIKFCGQEILNFFLNFPSLTFCF